MTGALLTQPFPFKGPKTLHKAKRCLFTKFYENLIHAREVRKFHMHSCILLTALNCSLGYDVKNYILSHLFKNKEA